jgi:hypothetical protein
MLTRGRMPTRNCAIESYGKSLRFTLLWRSLMELFGSWNRPVSWAKWSICLQLISYQICHCYIPQQGSFESFARYRTSICKNRLHFDNPQLPRMVLRTAIVTGANRGLGLATSCELLSRGYSVILGVKPQQDDSFDGSQVRLRTVHAYFFAHDF